MKKILTGLTVVLMCAASFAALTDNGEIAANIASTTALTAASYPTNTSTGTPTAITDGTGCTDVLVVDDIVITDNSIAGWSLTVTQTNGNLVNATNSATIAYSLEIGNVSGTLGTGLTLDPAVGTALTFTAGDAVISPTGTATTSTSGYTFDLLMTIADAATVGKLAGDYKETLSLTLASDD